MVRRVAGRRGGVGRRQGCKGWRWHRGSPVGAEHATHNGYELPTVRRLARGRGEAPGRGQIATDGRYLFALARAEPPWILRPGRRIQNGSPSRARSAPYPSPSAARTRADSCPGGASRCATGARALSPRARARAWGAQGGVVRGGPPLFAVSLWKPARWVVRGGPGWSALVFQGGPGWSGFAGWPLSWGGPGGPAPFRGGPTHPDHPSRGEVDRGG
jgi:hypothetical protein